MLKAEMDQLVKRAKVLVKSFLREPDHWTICRDLATEFELWKDERFPIWLSRVVAGVIEDVRNKEDTYP